MAQSRKEFRDNQQQFAGESFNNAADASSRLSGKGFAEATAGYGQIEATLAVFHRLSIMQSQLGELNQTMSELLRHVKSRDA